MAPNANFENNSVWDVNEMTSAGISKRSDFQASSNINSYGSSSVQWKGDKFSAWLHTWSISPSANPLVNYWSIAFGGPISGDNRAWSTSIFGSNPMLCSGHFQKVHKLYSSGGIVFYNYVGLFIRDVTTGHEVNIVVSAWDSRVGMNFTEYMGNDVQMGAFVQSYIGGRRYTTPMPWTRMANTDTEKPEEWYGFCITRENLANIIADYNNKIQKDKADYRTIKNTTPAQKAYFEKIKNIPRLSSNLNNYSLSGVTLQPEAALVRNPNAGGHVGITMRENWIFTRY